MGNINLLTIFLTGLLTGGLSCMAVQGGLLASTIAQRSSFVRTSGNKEEELKHKLITKGDALPIGVFLVAKLTAYTILGFLLGWFGSLFKLSMSIQVLMQFIVAVFMIGTALNLLNIHPVFRYFVIQPPKFLTRLVRKQSKNHDIFAPGVLGAFTIFIPCGTTQAMMALAIASGNPFIGAAILFSFIIGTSPVFFLLGYFATKLSDTLHAKFMKFAALAIILLALFNLNNTLALAGMGISLSQSKVAGNQTPPRAVTEATIYIGPSGYVPNIVTLKTNSAVTLNLINKDSYNCASAFTIPTLGIQRVVQVGTTERIQFQTPPQPTQIAFMCSMGMFRGYINVVGS